MRVFPRLHGAMRGHCILSHGFESGPDATKVTALAEAAGRLGFTHERPDYTDPDAKPEVSPLGHVAARVEPLPARFRGGRLARGLAHVLKRRGLHFIASRRRLEVVERLDVSAHAPRVTALARLFPVSQSG